MSFFGYGNRFARRPEIIYHRSSWRNPENILNLTGSPDTSIKALGGKEDDGTDSR